MKRFMRLEVENLPTRKRLGSYDFEGFPANAVLLEVGTGKMWLNDNGLHGGDHYDLREIRNGAVEVQSGAYVYFPSRRWVHDHFDMVGTATLVGAPL